MSLTVSLIAVLIPLLFMGDIVGRLFREFAVTLGVTILVSAVVSLTLTPMMCARLLHHTPAAQQGRFYRASERVFDRMIDAYARTPALGAGAPARDACWSPSRVLVLTVVLYVDRAEGLLPGAGHRRDPRHLGGAAVDLVPGHGRAPAGAGARSSSQDPAVASLSSFIGIDGTNTTLNSGRIQINLKPLAERGVERRRRHPPPAAGAGGGAGHHALLQPVQDLTVEDRVSRTQYQYSLEDADAGGAAPLGAAAGRGAARAAGAARRRQRPAGRAACRRRWTSTATPRRASASRRR